MTLIVKLAFLSWWFNAAVVCCTYDTLSRYAVTMQMCAFFKFDDDNSKGNPLLTLTNKQTIKIEYTVFATIKCMHDLALSYLCVYILYDI